MSLILSVFVGVRPRPDDEGDYAHTHTTFLLFAIATP
jgi:hypothetical protein